ncbi:MAG: DUF5615 family PIN-like protein [Bacteroidota bacterium]
MKFIVDTQLPPKLATYISELGNDCIHTTHFPDGHLLGDNQIIEIAKTQNRIVISKDSDFTEYFMLKGAPPQVLLIEFGNIGNKELLGLFESFFSEVKEAFQQGSDLVIFRKDEVISY